MSRRGDGAPVSARVLAEAIDWQLRLGEGMAPDVDRAALAAWLAAHPEHERAWRQLGEIDAGLSAARSGHVRRLLTARPRRTGLATGLMLLLGLGSGTLLLDRFQPVPQLLADHRTGTGERQRLVLPDGSILHLDARSAVDLAFDGRQRAVILREGGIFIETSHADAAERRPFLVLTEDGSLRALGTRFVVSRRAGEGDGGTHLTVTASAVAARPAGCRPLPSDACDGERIVRAGQAALLSADGVGAPVPAAADADAWRDGMLVADDLPLAEVVAGIARHRAGLTRVDPAVADLRVTGTLPLDNPDLALDALTQALPVEIRRRGSWWASVVARP